VIDTDGQFTGVVLRHAAQHGLAADTAGGGALRRGTLLASWPRRPGATGQRPRRS